MRAWVLALTMGIMVACGGGSDTPEPSPTPTESRPAVLRVSGTFVLVIGINGDNKAPYAGDECTGRRGYDDIREGMEVLLTDGGETLDVARFGQGQVTKVHEERIATPTLRSDRNAYYWYGQVDCTFEFSLDIPPGHDFYTVKVGRRGERTYGADEIGRPGALAYTIGP